MRFLFPSNYFKPQRVDSAYTEQCDRLHKSGFDTSVISLENLSLGASKIYPPPHPDEKLIYRGWMISPDEHSLLVNAVRNTGADLWIDRDEYLSTHYLPNWYPLLQDLTPETYWFNVDADLNRELIKLGWNKFFIKDYVKSLKTSIGSIIKDPSEIGQVVAEMHKFRGTIEGGICVRKVEDFITETEQRYFIINGRAFAASTATKIPDIVKVCASRINSKFFSVDIIDRIDGCQRVVEIGDGQVSGLVGWSVERFTDIWAESFLDIFTLTSDRVLLSSSKTPLLGGVPVGRGG
ncbi:ATP-grasp domain-containing protein [Chamaesiphon sp. VAR_48_metabat_403]|uniref:ATP-grasp domain-containing protein n=1 Tax=Chamaesiphon sp. VAR_48_metabat_403 TaxID=2964700 RepID=UPI00286E15B4|nr:ATP-grasp domain-containing protein [Chamaesiphon sp. VAR_48_metabat_403]